MIKRIFDVVAAGAALLVLSPILALAAIAVKLSSPGPVLHRAERVGRGAELFTVLKFRTMRVTTDVGAGITRSGDARITPVGRLLRRSKIDELPQLVNVLRGEMSLVGPRPEDPRYVNGYTEEQRGVLSVRPGITSPASVAFRHEEHLLGAASGDVATMYTEQILPRKLEIDLAYMRRRTFWSDLGVLIRTGAGLFARR